MDQQWVEAISASQTQTQQFSLLQLSTDYFPMADASLMPKKTNPVFMIFLFFTIVDLCKYTDN